MRAYREILRYAWEAGTPVFRVSLRRFAPMSTPPRSSQGLGWFDDPKMVVGDDSEGFAVLYCAENPGPAFIESLAGFRPRLQELGEIGRHVVMDVQEGEELRRVAGRVTANWCRDWSLTSAEVVTSVPVLDLANPSAVQFAREALAPSLIALGLDDLDFGDVLGADRRLTRAISRWCWSMRTEGGHPLFAGIRYRSRFDPDATCLALYDGRFEVMGNPVVGNITSDTPGFMEAVTTLRLDID